MTNPRIKLIIPLYSLFISITPHNLLSQYSNLKLENSQFIFDKNYEVDSISSLEIENLIKTGLPRLNGITMIQIYKGFITAKIDGIFIDYKKYGGRWGSTLAALNHPFYADLTILWKDGKYKVLVSNMYFNVNGFGIIKCHDLFINKQGNELRDGVDVIKAGVYIEKHLSDLFKLNPKLIEW
jgi:hypothetical protein